MTLAGFPFNAIEKVSRLKPMMWLMNIWIEVNPTHKKKEEEKTKMKIKQNKEYKFK